MIYNRNVRVELEVIKQQASNILDNTIVGALSEYTSDFVGILNEHRQFIFGNSKFFNTSQEDIIGFRPGEVFGCIHHKDSEFGCGAGDACRYCDAVNTVIKSITNNEIVESEGRIQVGDLSAPDTMIVSVKSVPINWKDEKFILLFIKDIGTLRMSELMDRIFFHDILNSAHSLNSILILSKIESEAIPDSKNLAEKNLSDITDQITYYRKLKAVEQNIVISDLQHVNLQDETLRIIESVKAMPAARSLSFETDIEMDIQIDLEAVIFRRVLLNMLKNAVEAESAGSAIRIFSEQDEDKIIITVQNTTVMSKEVKAQIFQKSFSTKGTGRGLGTYSMRLLTEKVLGGEIRFKSEEGIGTQFTLEIPLK